MNLQQVRRYIAQECLDHVLNGRGNLVFNTFTGCYDDKTEILTKYGWKFFKDLKKTDKVATFIGKSLEYEHPSAIQKYSYIGEMIKLNHRSIDLLVTPDHNMYIKKPHKKQFEFIKASDCTQYYYHILNTVSWKGKEKEFFKYKNTKIKMDHWLEFLGLYIADGFVNHTGTANSVFIRQKKKHNYKKIEKILNNLGFDWKFYEEGRFYFSSEDLHEYLKKLGKSLEKHIPNEFMSLSSRQLKFLYNGLLLGDGHVRGKNVAYYTCSKKLEGQFQELCIKLGMNSTSSFRKNRVSYIRGRKINSKNKQYEISVNNRKYQGVGSRYNSFSKQQYNGNVYCCTVSSHVILVRRNGKTCWCGNSGKSTTVLKTLHESSSGLLWIYLAPYHAVIEENIELSHLVDYSDVIHLMGRDKLCLSKQYKEYAKMGINIQPFCENFCPRKDSDCPYYAALRSLREMPSCFAGVHAHIPTLLQQLFFEKIAKDVMFYEMYDVVVIDEFPMNTIFNQISVNNKDIDYARDVLEMTQISGNICHLIRRMLNVLSLSTNSIGIDYEKLHNLFVGGKIDFKPFKEEYNLAVLGLVEDEIIKNLPQDIIYMLIEIYNKFPSLEELTWMIHKTKNSEWMKSRIFFTISNLGYFSNIPVKIISLDGTADLQTWKSVIGSNTTSVRFDLEYKNTYQLVGARNPVSTIVKNNALTKYGKRLAELVKIICEYKSHNVLICGTKRVETLVSKFLKDKGINNFVFANYYNLRSRNYYYETCDTCVLFHEPNIPPFQTNIIENVLGLDRGIVSKINTEDEMKQGIGRNRINIPFTASGRKRDKREIFIFSSTAYNKLVPEAKYMTSDQLRAYITLGKKRLYFDNLKSIIMKVSPITKNKLCSALNMTRNRLDYVLSVLEKQGLIKINWGEINWIKEETDKQKEEFIIKLGGY